jgi:ubiquinone/menaquinone biosynthesis C-methylase UbiE
MFTKTAQYYDLIYFEKDYQAEVNQLLELIREHGPSTGDRLLDVACGTGHHIQYLKEHFSVEGLDINPELIEIARQRNPEILVNEGNMIAFNLGRKFDLITCLFSSIGYVKTLENLSKAITAMADHLIPGGLLLVEPWFTPDQWTPDTVHALFIDEPTLKIARVNTSYAEGRLSYFDLHYLIGTPQKTEHFVESHELGLFERGEMEAAFSDADLQVAFHEEGLIGRGLYIASKPSI